MFQVKCHFHIFSKVET